MLTSITHKYSVAMMTPSLRRESCTIVEMSKSTTNKPAKIVVPNTTLMITSIVKIVKNVTIVAKIRKKMIATVGTTYMVMMRMGTL